MSVALLSQAKKSECGTAQRNSCIADDNVLNKQYARTTSTEETIRIQTLVQTDRQTDRKAGHRVAPQLKNILQNKNLVWTNLG